LALAPPSPVPSSVLGLVEGGRQALKTSTSVSKQARMVRLWTTSSKRMVHHLWISLQS
jgi:hypothetical protein